MGCAPAPAPDAFLQFVRGGVIVGAGQDGRVLADGRRLVERGWTPGEALTVAGVAGVAPQRAECVSIVSVDLGDASRLAALGVSAPDTALAWSPDQGRLAVGTALGELLVIDGWSGAVLARRRFPEAVVKALAWAPDGATLYAGEQSPDATMHALDPSSLADRWTQQLAERVESSPAPAGDDVYGVYGLPSVFGLAALPDGALIVAAAHGWPVDGGRRNRGQLLRLEPSGAVAATWPAAPGAFTVTWPRVDLAGGLLAVPVGHSATEPAPAGYPINGVQVLRLADLSPVTAVAVPPLAPWYTSTFVWEGAGVSAAQDTVLLGLTDGRLVLAGLDGQVRHTVDAGTPILAGEVPISAGIGHALLWRDAVVAVTSPTTIPWGAASPELRPPTTHPGANSLLVFGLDGVLRWAWKGAYDLDGASLGGDGHTLVVGAGQRAADDREDLFGALLFDLERPAGADQLVAVCPTAAPVFTRQALGADGRLALVEHPWKRPDGSIDGAYRVGIFR